MKSRFQEKKSNKFKIFLTFVFFLAAASFYSSEKINQFSQKITTPSQAKLKEVKFTKVEDGHDVHGCDHCGGCVDGNAFYLFTGGQKLNVVCNNDKCLKLP